MKEPKTQNRKIAPEMFTDLGLFMKGAKTQTLNVWPWEGQTFDSL